MFQGFVLWQKHVENSDEAEGKKAGQRATAGDHRAFDDFASDVNGEQPAPS